MLTPLAAGMSPYPRDVRQQGERSRQLHHLLAYVCQGHRFHSDTVPTPSTVENVATDHFRWNDSFLSVDHRRPPNTHARKRADLAVASTGAVMIRRARSTSLIPSHWTDPWILIACVPNPEQSRYRYGVRGLQRLNVFSVISDDLSRSSTSRCRTTR